MVATGGVTAGSGGDVSTGGGTSCGTSLVATDATNMTLTSDLTIDSATLQGNNLDLVFDWSAVTTDFYGHAIDFNDIELVALVPWPEPIDVIAELINADDPSLQSLAGLPIVFRPKLSGTPVTSASLLEFTDVGYEPVPEDTIAPFFDPAGGYSFTLILQEHPESPGIEARMIQGFTVSADATETTLMVGDSSTLLQASATLGAPLSAPAATPGLMLDWTSDGATDPNAPLKNRSYGGAFNKGDITEVLVGQYPAGIDLAAGILDIEVVYTNLWRGRVEVGSSMDLSSLTSVADGSPFPGINDTDQWLVGLLCTTEYCRNPTPWYLAPMTPCP